MSDCWLTSGSQVGGQSGRNQKCRIRSGYLPSDTESPLHVWVHFYPTTVSLSPSLALAHTHMRTHGRARTYSLAFLPVVLPCEPQLLHNDADTGVGPSVAAWLTAGRSSHRCQQIVKTRIEFVSFQEEIITNKLQERRETAWYEMITSIFFVILILINQAIICRN